MVRMRSPNFPGIPLEQAIKLVDVIYKNNRQNLISRESAVKDLGYSGLTGRSMKLLGALNQYDLVANASKGNLRVTQTAVDILHGIEEADRKAALKKAGRAPALFKQIFDRFEDGIPSENAVRSFLITSGFTDKGVGAALKSFWETNRYLELKQVYESYGSSPLDEQESLQDDLEEEEIDMEQYDTGGSKTSQRRAEQPIVRAVEQQNGPLKINFDMTELRVSGVTTDPDELQDFIEDLETLKAILEKRRKAQVN